MSLIKIDYQSFKIKIKRYNGFRQIQVNYAGETNEYDFDIFKQYLSFQQKIYPRVQADSLFKSMDQVLLELDMVGVVSAVMVKPGQAVKKGQVLLSISAMKIENEITAPINGVIKKVFVKSGQKLALNSKLVEIKNEDF
jgi:biotin carboxyl carrier protein